MYFLAISQGNYLKLLDWTVLADGSWQARNGFAVDNSPDSRD
jgi:hypothetical protein